MKVCSKCHKSKEISEFHKDNKSKDGLFAYCKNCSYKITFLWRDRNKEKVTESRRKYYLSHKERLQKLRKDRYALDPQKAKEQQKRWARISLLNKYNLTQKSFDDLLEKQSRRCGICKKIFSKKINIDHCHKTGETRGLLCTSCNTSLGHIEKEGFLEKAKQYLSLYTKNY